MILVVWSISLAVGVLALAWVLPEVAAQILLKRQFAKKGRFKKWSEVIESLRRAEGTILIEDSGVVGRIWWHPDTFEISDVIFDDHLQHAYLTAPPLRHRSIKKLSKQFGEKRVREVQGHSTVDP